MVKEEGGDNVELVRTRLFAGDVGLTRVGLTRDDGTILKTLPCDGLQQLHQFNFADSLEAVDHKLHVRVCSDSRCV